jgi:hypothetical protein
MARNTFATFMQPNLDHEVEPGKTFAQFARETIKGHH